MSKFYEGQRVVCIDDIFSDMEIYKSVGNVFPNKNEIYTIRSIARSLHGKVYKYGFRLMEIINPVLRYEDGIDEMGFNETNFSPIEEYTDSLSIAESLVKELSEVDKAKKPIKELVNA